MAQMVLDLVASFGTCLNCFPGSPQLKINGRSLKILRLLGEGGFSYVYLVQDPATSETFALKKIRCPFGAESVSLALREVSSYAAFAAVPGIIRVLDHSIATERAAGEEAKTVYVLLPYYKCGDLQDQINANLVNGSHFPEKKLMILFLGVCRALKGMHKYRPNGNGGSSSSAAPKPMERMRMGNEEDIISDSSSDSEDDGAQKSLRTTHASASSSAPTALHDGGDSAAQKQPLMPSSAFSTARSFAHRDIKPGNIMLDDSGTPILMDLGSVAASPLEVTSHSQAIAVQDTAAEHSTMPYRAPELFDVRSGMVIDTKVDIWSLGCTLYACLVGKSPFEARSDETGGTLSLCVLGGDWRFPDEGPGAVKRTGSSAARGGINSGEGAAKEVVISEGIKHIVRKCLAVEAAERPDIDELINLVEDVVDSLDDN